MCLTVYKQKEVRIALKDILVYKAAYDYGCELHTPY